jgi:hypothetical protein
VYADADICAGRQAAGGPVDLHDGLVQCQSELRRDGSVVKDQE